MISNTSMPVPAMRARRPTGPSAKKTPGTRCMRSASASALNCVMLPAPCFRCAHPLLAYHVAAGLLLRCLHRNPRQGDYAAKEEGTMWHDIWVIQVPWWERILRAVVVYVFVVV